MPRQKRYPAGMHDTTKHARLHLLITADFHVYLFVWLESMCKKPGQKNSPAGWTRGLLFNWQEWRGSNPQPPVLETGALPIELHSYGPLIASL